NGNRVAETAAGKQARNVFDGLFSGGIRANAKAIEGVPVVRDGREVWRIPARVQRRDERLGRTAITSCSDLHAPAVWPASHTRLDRRVGRGPRVAGVRRLLGR